MDNKLKSTNNQSSSGIKFTEILLDPDNISIVVSIDDKSNLYLNYNFKIYREVSIQLQNQLDEIITNDNILNIIIDLKETLHLDSLAISTLIAIKKKVKGYCKLANVDPSVIEMFEILNLDQLFVIEIA